MKKIIVGSFVALTLAAGGYANAADYPCTTKPEDDPYANTPCYSCTLSWFHGSINCRTDAGVGSLFDSDVYLGLYETNSKTIDDCVGNDDGQMVHGLGAGDSCKDYNLDNDLLTAKCRNGAGVYVDTSISIPDFFAADQAWSQGVDVSIVCVQ